MKFTAVLSQNNMLLQKHFLCSLIQYFISFMTLFPAFYTIMSRVRAAARQDEESRSDISGLVQRMSSTDPQLKQLIVSSSFQSNLLVVTCVFES